VFLTTHYLDEADQLCDRVAIVDHGQVIALGTPDALKRRYSGNTIAVTPDVEPDELTALARELAEAVSARPTTIEHGAIKLTVTDPTAAMAAVFGILASRGVDVLDASVGRPSLDDVFLGETGRSLRDAGTTRAMEVAA
jgi:ABC-2 type transport system ATP-binding protein